MKLFIFNILFYLNVLMILFVNGIKNWWIGIFYWEVFLIYCKVMLIDYFFEIVCGYYCCKLRKIKFIYGYCIEICFLYLKEIWKKNIFKFLVLEFIKRWGNYFEVFYLLYICIFIYSNYFCFLFLYLYIIFIYIINICKCVRIYKFLILI